MNLQSLKSHLCHYIIANACFCIPALPSHFNYPFQDTDGPLCIYDLFRRDIDTKERCQSYMLDIKRPIAPIGILYGICSLSPSLTVMYDLTPLSSSRQAFSLFRLLSLVQLREDEEGTP